MRAPRREIVRGARSSGLFARLTIGQFRLLAAVCIVPIDGLDGYANTLWDVAMNKIGERTRQGE